MNSPRSPRIPQSPARWRAIRRFTPVLALTLLEIVLASQSLVAAGAEPLLLRNATVHTVVGPTREHTDVLVRDGRIAEVGTDLRATGATVVELAGAHLYPGMIALSTGLGLVEIEGVRATRDTTETGDYTPEVYAWVAVHADSELIAVARANGITHAESVPSGGTISGHSALIALDGWTIEDLAVKRAAALHVFWPAMDLDLTPKEHSANPEHWKSIEDQTKERERRLKRLDDFFLEAEAYQRAARGPSGTAAALPLPGEATPRPTPSALASGNPRVPAWEAMGPALRGEIPVFVHANELRQIRAVVEWTERHPYRVVIAGGRDAWRLADTLARRNLPVAFEDVFTLPQRDTDAYDVHYAAPGALARAGVKVAFAGGADRMDASNIRNLPYAAAQAVAYGLSAEEALRGLTLYPAEILGLADRLGSIAPGKEASLFVADGDILDIRTAVLRLWIQGREVSLESRHTRLYDRYRSRPRP